MRYKALEIIKEKEVDVEWFVHCENMTMYNSRVLNCQALTQEEYDTLKEELLYE